MTPTVHANCVVVGEAGVLIRGASGAGKSSFSAALVDYASAQGLFARLVADDRVRFATRGGRLTAAVPEAIAGLIERRGVGILRTPYLARAVVRLIVDIEASVERMPDGAAACEIEGVMLPRLAIARGAPDGPALTVLALRSKPAGADCGAIALAFDARKARIRDTMGTPSNLKTGRAGVARGGLRTERNEFCAETE